MNWRWPTGLHYNPERPGNGGGQEVGAAHSPETHRPDEIECSQLVVETLLNQVLKGRGQYNAQRVAAVRPTTLEPRPEVTRVIARPWQVVKGEMLLNVGVIWPGSTMHTDAGQVAGRIRSHMKYGIETRKFSLLSHCFSETSGFLDLLEPESMDRLRVPAGTFIATLYPKECYSVHPSLSFDQPPNQTKTEQFLRNVLSYVQIEDPYVPR